MSSSLSRRRFMGAGAGAGLASLLAACGTPVGTSLTGGQPDTADVIFWHLFSGGDGANMTTMVDRFEATGHLSVEATLLSWGNPYYTKLALSASSGRPPDVAISHLSRLPLLAQAGLLEPVARRFARVGVTEDKFTPAAWSKATVDGTVYAIPLDTHPFVLYYNVDLAKKAGLLNSSGDDLAPMNGADDFVEALTAMRKVTGKYGGVVTVTADPSTCWRLFTMVYRGVAGPIVSDQGTRVSIDADAMEETFAFLQKLTARSGLMPANASPVTTTTLFSQGQAGFLFDGEWQIPTYRGVTLPNGSKLDFNVVPFPALLGPKPVAYADSHSLVIPRSSGRSAAHARDAVTFIKGLLEESAIWAGGGHVPAWLPVQRSRAFLEQKPQRNYVQAAFNAVYDPVAWYTGAGSDFQTSMGSVISDVLSGHSSPQRGVRAMTASLKAFSTARPPVD